MDIEELTNLVKEQMENRNYEESIEFLKAVGVIDEDGCLSENFYSREVIEEYNKEVINGKV